MGEQLRESAGQALAESLELVLQVLNVAVRQGVLKDLLNSGSEVMQRADGGQCRAVAIEPVENDHQDRGTDGVEWDVAAKKFDGELSIGACEPDRKSVG